jgi:uncharacterized protein DUF4338/transposase-like protein/transposase Tn5 family protein
VKACGQEFSKENIARIQEMVDEEPEMSRRELSRRVSDLLNWRSLNGKRKDMSIRVALLKLERQGEIRMTPAVPFPAARKGTERKTREAAEERSEVTATLAKVQPVELIRVGSADSAASRIWKKLMEGHHPLGSGPLCGAQMRYLIRSGGYGYLGGLSFSAAAWQLKARDEWIEWSAGARKQNLHLVINNSRLLILPGVHVANLASHVLGLAVRRVRQDWKERYGYEPLLVETFVEEAQHQGTCYRAANWKEVGRTQGRGRQDEAHQESISVKRVFVYKLDRQARKQLCIAMPETEASAEPRLEPQDWAEQEFGGTCLDQRLGRRLMVIARDFYAHPQAQIPEACQSRSKTKAAYRFFKHKDTEMDVLLEPHYQATQQRIAEHQIVLAVQDTTSLNYSTHPATKNLGPIGSQSEGIIGLMVHDTMAFSLEGTPLGLVDVQCWARDGAEFGKKHQRKQRRIEEKESHKWLKSFRHVAEVQRQCPHTMLVSVGDREADIYELFHLALEDPKGPQLLVRAEQNRLLEDGQGHLWPLVEQQPLAGMRKILVPRRKNQPAREAWLEIRFAEVTLKPPHGKSRYGSLQLWAVLAQEVDAPEGIEPLSWMLLTTCSVTSFAESTEKLDWYTKRWCIEIYHKTLKSGCKIEQRQLSAADTIEACLAVDLVVAWRIYHLTKLGRECPHVPCTVFFEDAEWKALVTHAIRQPVPPDYPPPPLGEAVRMVGALGGHLGRKSDGQPGTESLWRGLERLGGMTEMYKLLVPHLRPPLVSSAPRYG